jgi:hypothetical protein
MNPRSLDEPGTSTIKAVHCLSRLEVPLWILRFLESRDGRETMPVRGVPEPAPRQSSREWSPARAVQSTASHCGDFTRRFDQDSVLTLMEAINATRQRVWEKQPGDFLWQAFVDIDGTLAGTLGECKGGMALSYKGIWGYAPLIITLANTREVLYLVNRPGNVVSHEGCVPWIDRAIELLRPRAGEITLR